MDESLLKSEDWHSWNANTWGAKLFRHYFVTTNEDVRPLSRLSFGIEELVAASGLTFVDPGLLRASFLRAISCSAEEFRQHLSLNAVATRRARPYDVPPNYLAYLLFTCFAAMSLDGNTIDVGEFRARLRVLLGHPAGTSYQLPELPYVWEDLRDWLNDRRRAGAPYRELILPHPGWKVRIGYSTRLAFPSRGDQVKLRDVVREINWQRMPTVDEAIKAIGDRLSRFSVDFHEVFGEARQAFLEGEAAPPLQALWSAVVDAISAANVPLSDRTSRVRYQLVLQLDTELSANIFLLATQAPDVPTERFEFTPLDDPIGEYDSLVRRKSEQGGLATASWLLSGARPEHPPYFQHGPLSRVIQDGLLLFQRGDVATWELATSRPGEGAVCALVADWLCSPLLEHFGGLQPKCRDSKIDGWVELEPFDIASLPAVTPSTTPLLAGIRCLQATSVGSQISLSNGIRVENGYLGLHGLLPVVRCADSSGMELYKVPPASTGLSATSVAELCRHSEFADAFIMPDDVGDLEGAYRVVARGDQQGAIMSRGLSFHTRVLGHAFKPPGNGAHWTIEAAGPAMLSAEDGLDTFLETGPPADAEAAPLPEDRPGHDVTCPAIGAQPGSVDDDSRLDRFVEALAALSTNRKGITEAEVLDLLKRIIGVDDWRLSWDVMRGWMEAGYLDSLSRRRWRGRVYFGRRPRLVLSRSGELQFVTLHGLAPYRLRVRARTVFAELGARPRAALSMSHLVSSPQSWIVESPSVAVAAANELRLGPPEFARRGCGFLWTRDQVTEERLPELPRYEFAGRWDWNDGVFRGGYHEMTTSTVRIERHVRADRPDLFVLLREEAESWSTHMRNWALIIGYAWANVPAFTACGQIGLDRLTTSGPYVPLPVARATVLESGVASGPTEPIGDLWRYAYSCTTNSARDALIGLLQPGNVRFRHTNPWLPWLIATIAGSPRPADGVPLPIDLLSRLRELDEEQRTTWLPGKRVSRRLLPHIRRAVRLTEA